jgi:hypothetical protein
LIITGHIIAIIQARNKPNADMLILRRCSRTVGTIITLLGGTIIAVAVMFTETEHSMIWDALVLPVLITQAQIPSWCKHAPTDVQEEPV